MARPSSSPHGHCRCAQRGVPGRDGKGRKIAELGCGGPARDVTDILRDGRAVTHLCTWLVLDALSRQPFRASSWKSLLLMLARSLPGLR